MSKENTMIVDCQRQIASISKLEIIKGLFLLLGSYFVGPNLARQNEAYTYILCLSFFLLTTSSLLSPFNPYSRIFGMDVNDWINTKRFKLRMGKYAGAAFGFALLYKICSPHLAREPELQVYKSLLLCINALVICLILNGLFKKYYILAQYLSEEELLSRRRSEPQKSSN